MHALSQYMGKEKVNGALRSLLQKHHSGELSLPTTLDLYQELQELTPDSLNYLLSDLFKKNPIGALKREICRRKRKPAWQVTLRVQAQKLVVDHTGKEQEVPMNDWLEVGLYEEGKGLESHSTFRCTASGPVSRPSNVTVPRKPERGGIDPNRLMIDLRVDDNMIQLEEG